MSIELIPVFPGHLQSGEAVFLVDGRLLHAFLEVGCTFPTWIVRRIQEYGFIENQDFIICFSNLRSNHRGGHNRKDYHLTLDMAKELAMVERNDKGRQARRYFIECERRLLAQQQAGVQSARPEMAGFTREECLDLIERCVERTVRAVLHAERPASGPSPSRRENFSEWEKAEILRLDGMGVDVAEIAALLYRPVSSVRSFLWRHRRARQCN